MGQGGTNDEHTIPLARRIMGQEIQALEAAMEALGGSFSACARLLVGCEGLIWVTGVGTSAAVGQRFAHILSCCGARSMFLSPAEGLHGHSTVLTPADLLVAMSRGGESDEVNQMVTIANRTGAATVAFVHDTESTLARTCSYMLPIQSPAEFQLLGYLATTSTVVFSAVCDALCAVVAETKGLSPERFGEVHPGGAVGKRFASGDSAT